LTTRRAATEQRCRSPFLLSEGFARVAADNEMNKYERCGERGEYDCLSFP
jgi:hypothetical protein